jgi:uncharacterized protein (TIGR03067 family)
MNLVLFAVALTVADGGEPAHAYEFVDPDDFPRLQRCEWRIMYLWVNGEGIVGVLPDVDHRVVFRDGKMIMNPYREERSSAAAVKLNPYATPKRLDWGEDRLAIYRLENDVLQIAMGGDNEPRPMSFSAKEARFLIVLRPARPSDWKEGNPDK